MIGYSEPLVRKLADNIPRPFGPCATIWVGGEYDPSAGFQFCRLPVDRSGVINPGDMVGSTAKTLSRAEKLAQSDSYCP